MNLQKQDASKLSANVLHRCFCRNWTPVDLLQISYIDVFAEMRHKFAFRTCIMETFAEIWPQCTLCTHRMQTYVEEYATSTHCALVDTDQLLIWFDIQCIMYKRYRGGCMYVRVHACLYVCVYAFPCERIWHVHVWCDILFRSESVLLISDMTSGRRLEGAECIILYVVIAQLHREPRRSRMICLREKYRKKELSSHDKKDQ